MDRQPQNQSQQQGKRQYGCPCGKTYLSYPALFTHVKQKHDGKPPGALIKPKTQKARGRPKIHIDVPEDDMSDGAFNFQEELEEALPNINISYNETVKTSDGNRSCQDMVSTFLNKTNFIKSEDKKKILQCYINQLKHFVDIKMGEQFWSQERPTDLVLMVNDIYKSHEQVQEIFPIPKQYFVDLTYVFFRWMYKNKWTCHKLIKREAVEVIRPV